MMTMTKGLGTDQKTNKMFNVHPMYSQGDNSSNAMGGATDHVGYTEKIIVLNLFTHYIQS